MHRAEEDYIKTIYEQTVEKQKPLIKLSELSASLELTDQTVNEMVKKLSSKQLAEFIPYKGIKLTLKGRIEAVRLVRAHRLWEVFLTEKLGYGWDEVHQEAEKLEHATSQKLLYRLDAFLGYPKNCGHGNPIPHEDGSVFGASNLSLYNLKEGDAFKIVRVIDNKELLQYLDKNQIAINSCYTVRSKDNFSKIIKIDGEKTHYLSQSAAAMIFVELLHNIK